ncbi:helix-turn-helix domain-containing protein [Reyranella soli]|jgi:AraC-like DNA-binding protein|uniref:AraC family transcriptional regulator n=1 Tax=Reyranella soli TaxID=1230389 RepID=A0A512NH02_9HYPH|nr:helix-turn-helix domain-containing protein [Reyranella soli]GEP58230.1 AraC family transcriptional regulator [Reyranella soli]
MTPKRFETASLPPREQFAAWHAWYSSFLDTAVTRTPDEGFSACSETWSLGGLTISDGTAPAIFTARTKTLIRRNPVDHWVLTLCRRGTVALQASNGSVSFEPGVPFVVSLADVMVTTKTDYSRVQFYLSRSAFAGVAALLDAARGKPLDTPEGALLADYMLLLVSHLRDLAPEDGPRIAAAVEAMVGACLAPSAERWAGAQGQIDFTLMERVRRAVRAHLRSPLLGPEKLCHEAATSRSQLYRLLEGEGGVAHYIRRQRLSESFAMLCDVSHAVPIGRIADILCFSDASSFSRAFRREFGMSPRDVRAASVAGLQPSVSLKETAPDGIQCFADCLSGA